MKKYVQIRSIPCDCEYDDHKDFNFVYFAWDGEHVTLECGLVINAKNHTHLFDSRECCWDEWPPIKKLSIYTSGAGFKQIEIPLSNTVIAQKLNELIDRVNDLSRNLKKDD